MKPTKPGFYWYRDWPVRVYSNTYLMFERLGHMAVYRVGETVDLDWGEEIRMTNADD